MEHSELASGMPTCKGRYEKLAIVRRQFLDRARECSALTIPTLVPPEGSSSSTIYDTPWQGLGARGVNNLASKLLMSLMPPNAPFFKLSVDDFTLERIAGTDQDRAEVDKALGRVERAVKNEMEITGMRNSVFIALKHLIVGGNILLYLPKDGNLRVFPLSNYVVKRDPQGDVLEIIILEKVDRDNASEDILQIINDRHVDGSYDATKDEAIEVFTKFYRDGKKWKLYQEVLNTMIPGTDGEWPIDKSPMLVLRWVPVENEDYGRSHVEEYLGDLVTLEALSKAVVEAAAASSKVVFLVNPNGTTRAKDITDAESGSAITGNAADVHALQTEKQADLRIANEVIRSVSERLAHAFLLNSSIQRQAERVTAEEIRFMAGELEDALGGVYSVLSQEFQLPLVTRVMDRMQKSKRLPTLPKDIVQPVIVTGLEALGRGHDLTKLQTLMKLLEPLGPEALRMVNVGSLITRLATSLMIDTQGLLKTEEQLQQEEQQMMQMQQQQQMMELAKSAAPNAVKAVGDRVPAPPQPQQ